jgi:hypothetical protein
VRLHPIRENAMLMPKLVSAAAFAVAAIVAPPAQATSVALATPLPPSQLTKFNNLDTLTAQPGNWLHEAFTNSEGNPLFSIVSQHGSLTHQPSGRLHDFVGQGLTTTITFVQPVNGFGVKLWRDSAPQVYGPRFRAFFDDGTFEEFSGPQETVGQQFGFTTGRQVVKLELFSIKPNGYQGYAFDDLHFRFGGAPAAVPEPASWAMMIAGFGFTGAAMRRRRRRIAFA